MATKERVLDRFVDIWKKSFSPPEPYRGESGQNWLVSKVWSDYLRKWLRENFGVSFECAGRRLDAGVWLREVNKYTSPKDLAVEWEWDNNKVEKSFPTGDFVKVLEVEARAGLAIIQTRVDGSRGTYQAETTLKNIRESYQSHKRDNGPIGVIEIRRVSCSNQQVNFKSSFHDLAKGTTKFLKLFGYSEE